MTRQSGAAGRSRSVETDPAKAVGGSGGRDVEDGDRHDGRVDPDERTQSDVVLRVDGITKTFENGDESVTAVDGVSFDVHDGEIVGLLGPNGAGKTTTIKSALGIVIPDAGTTEIAGNDTFEESRAAYDHVAALMEGARNLYWRLTVRENLEYFASIAGDDPSAIRDHHDRLLEDLGLLEHADEQVRRLSRGMKQKALIASTLARDVDLVFLDEPTLGLDVETALELRQTLRTLAADRNLTIVLSTHDMDVVEDVCDRAVIVDDGEVIADDSVANLLDSFETQGYRLTVRGIDTDAVASLEGAGAISDVTRVGDSVRFDVTADSESFYRLVAELAAAEARLDAVEMVTPDFEDVFVRLTGGGGQ